MIFLFSKSATILSRFKLFKINIFVNDASYNCLVFDNNVQQSIIKHLTPQSVFEDLRLLQHKIYSPADKSQYLQVKLNIIKIGVPLKNSRYGPEYNHKLNHCNITYIRQYLFIKKLTIPLPFSTKMFTPPKFVVSFIRDLLNPLKPMIIRYQQITFNCLTY